MSHQRITPCRIAAFASHLRALERSPATIACYLRHLRAFAQWLDGRAVNRIAVQDWKTHLADSGAAPSNVNSKLAALHSFFAFQGWQALRVRYLRVQRRLFRDPARELTRPSYERLRTAARKADPAARLLLETLAATGIRASELSHITVQAVRNGRADIRLKGKIRTILLVPSLCRKLRAFAKKQKIVHGAIFCTKDDRPYSRYQVWALLKRIAAQAGIDPHRVFPHNLRRLFAVTYYEKTRDIVRLADILGHSSIETTRLYLVTSGQEHTRQLESLRLVQ